MFQKPFSAALAMKATAGLLGLALALSGCARPDTDPDKPGTDNQSESMFRNGMIGEQDAPGEPTEGGTLSFAAYSEARSLDPAKTINTGSTGGTEMAAVYDVLLRHNEETLEYEPWLAESFETTDDKTYVLKLREGVTFSDGTPLNAEAVVWSINRYITNKGGQTAVWMLAVEKFEATGDLEVTFTLTRPWTGFGYLLATAPGMIVAKSSDGAGEEFTPTGAGPFTLERYAPGEELVLKRRDDYWKGTPHLEKLRFFSITSPTGRYETMTSGQSDIAYLREPHVVVDALKAGYPGFMEVSSLGRLVLVNHREGSNTADVRIRQAMSMALDPQLIADREFEGEGMPTLAMFPKESEWALDTEPLPHDPEQAKKLVEEAKADGHPGTVRFLGIANAGEAQGLALKAQWEAVGLEVKIENAPSVSDLVQTMYVSGDFDTVTWSFGVPDGGVLPEMYESFHSKGGGPNAYADEEMDKLVIELMEAPDHDAQKAVLEKIQKRYNETVPSISLGATPEYVAWQKNVHGVMPSVDSVVLLGEAFKAE
ncbi:ABC transporter substrate-binding protein [Enemella sp. A6]|uniref:ABC transporter substrate-binding protein n=1 Tax=Enemella sp. A6 TaxID=3440152 RepID=UPI003EBEF06E